MMEDVNTGIGWVLQKISNYGGDPAQVYLVGQSCGGQLCTLTTLIQVFHMMTCALIHTLSGVALHALSPWTKPIRHSLQGW